MADIKHLKCRECATDLRRRADPRLRVLLRPPRGRLRLRADRPGHQPRTDRGGAAIDLAVRRPPARLRGDAARRPRCRLHAARSGAASGGRARHQRSLAEERHRQPDVLLQGPRRLRRADEGDASSGSRSPRPARRATSATPSPRTPRRPACPRSSSCRTTSRSARSSRPSVYGATIVAIKGNYDEVNRLCAEVADAYPWAFVNTNIRAFYSEGSKTLAFEIVEQLGWRYPEHIVVPIGSGSQLVKVRKGLDELNKVAPDAGDRRTRRSTARRRSGARPVAQAFLERRRPRPSAEAGHDREVDRDRQSRRRPVRAPGDPRDRGPRRHRHRRGDRRRDPAPRADGGHLHGDRGRRDGRRAGEARRAGRVRIRASASSR